MKNFQGVGGKRRFSFVNVHFRILKQLQISRHVVYKEGFGRLQAPANNTSTSYATCTSGDMAIVLHSPGMDRQSIQPAPEYTSSAPAPPYSADPQPSERRLNISPRSSQRYLTRGNVIVEHKHATVVFQNQGSDRKTPSFGANSLIDGVVSAHGERDSITRVDFKVRLLASTCVVYTISNVLASFSFRAASRLRTRSMGCGSRLSLKSIRCSSTLRARSAPVKSLSPSHSQRSTPTSTRSTIYHHRSALASMR